MKYVKKLESEIKNNVNLEENLSQYMTEMSSAYYAYAGTNFVMHYYDLYEGIVDKFVVLEDNAKKLLQDINEVVKLSFSKEFDGEIREASIIKLHEVREEITKYMKVLTAYTDIFTLYEYAMNRIELKFNDKVEDIDNDSVAKEILNYIFEEQENATINERIKLMLSQMPVRMTKQKFFDLLKNALTIYEGGDKLSFQNFIYMIRSAAGVDESEGIDMYFKVLKECRNKFTACDFSGIDEEKYNELNQSLKGAIDYLVAATDGYYAIQQMLNYLYTLVLNQPYASITSHQSVSKLNEIVEAVNKGFMNETMDSIPDECVSLFSTTEGMLEQDIMKVQTLEGILDIITNQHTSLVNNLMLGKIYEGLILSSKLTSNSVFIELSMPKTEVEMKETNDTSTVEKKDILLAFDELYNELSDKLENQPKLLNRGMIAAVLKELPVFFSNHTEVMDYVKNSLASCRDSSEKVVSVRLMQELIEDSK